MCYPVDTNSLTWNLAHRQLMRVSTKGSLEAGLADDGQVYAAGEDDRPGWRCSHLPGSWVS